MMRLFRFILLSWILLVPHVGASPDGFEIVSKFKEAPGNVTVTPDGRVIMSLHQFYEPQYSVVEVLEDGSMTPFPNAELNIRSSQRPLSLDSVLGITADAKGIVWMLDNGLRGGVPPKLVGWDTKANKLYRVIYFTHPIVPKNAFVNDLAVDRQRERIFISDPAGGSNAALIVVNLETGLARRVLEGDSTVIPEDIELTINKRSLRMKNKNGKIISPKIGVNPIGIDDKNEWVYYGAMHGQSLYRIQAADLVNKNLDTKQLAAKIERYSDKPVSDGLTIDGEGNVYLGELAENAIGRITSSRKYERLVQSPKLSWVDSLSVGPKGDVYAVVNQLHLSAPLNAGKRRSKPPYYLIRLDPTKVAD